MRIAFYTLLILTFTIATASANRCYYQQDITSDTTWTRADSPVIIYGNVSIDDGAILTIENGVEVLFEKVTGDGGFRDGSELFVKNGSLIVLGNELDPVVFSSNSYMPSPGDWGCLVVEGNNIVNLRYAKIEYAKVGLYLYDLGYMSEIGSTFDYCSFKHNDEYGVLIYQSSPTLRYDIITDNTSGVGVLGNSSPTINFNDLYNNYNYDYVNNSSNNQDATSNWWGTVDPSLIELRIYDHLDSPSLGRVDYVPYLNGPAQDQGSAQTYSVGWLKSYFW
jgi:hypothetical protein